jgi:hypothetical protein
MTDLSIDVVDLEIKLHTNIPKQKVVPLTRALFHIPTDDDDDTPDENSKPDDDTNNSYLKFTTDVKYPVSELSKLSMHERIEFFFNAGVFAKELKKHMPDDADAIKTRLRNATSQDEVDAAYEFQNERIQHNFLTTLYLLFPTSYPVIDDIHTSLDYIKNNEYKHDLWFAPFKSFFQSSPDFSYLKIGGQIYTIRKSVWLNDILNNPSYHNIVKLYQDFVAWTETKKHDSKTKYGTVALRKQKLTTQIEGLFKDLRKETIIIGPPTNTSFTRDFKILYDLVTGNFNDTALKTYIDTNNWIKSGSHVYNPNPGGIVDKTKLARIHNDLITAYTRRGALISTTNAVDAYFTQRLEKNGNDIEIRKFRAEMNKYKLPFQTTTNIFLQQVINGLLGTNNTEVDEDDEASVEFYKFMNTLLHTYVNVSNNPPMENKNMLTLANIGLTIINTNEKKRYIADVLIDVIGGKLTAANKKSIYCPFTGDLLGDQLEDLMNPPIYNKTKPWSVFDGNRSMFSIEDLTSSRNDNKQNNASGLSTNTNITQNTSNKQQQQQPKNINELKSNFEVKIMNPAVTLALTTNITALQTKYNDTEIHDLNINNLLDFLIKYNNPLAKRLYAIITLWNQNQNTKTKNVYDMLVGIETGITARNKVITTDIADNVPAKNPDEILKLRREHDINEKILLVITSRVIEDENGKIRKMGGTRRKRKYQKKKTKKRKPKKKT